MGTSKIPDATRGVHARVTAQLNQVCSEHLSPEYLSLCRKAADSLARKRPSPLLSGQPQSWACGIAYAIGRNNFLFDPAQNPHVPAGEICRLFGVSPATGSAKAKAVEKSLKIRFMDPQWTIPSILARNPMTWMLELNGVIIDIRKMPREIQEMAYIQGLIPWIPADREENEQDKPAEPPASASPEKVSRSSPKNGKHRCGLCGKSGRLTRTECCNQLVCDDEDQYVLFSYEHNSCYRNHSRYTLCGYHFVEEHSGKWQDCSKCREDFPGELYAYYGTNDYNFVKLENVPDYEPTLCARCSRVISLVNDGYSISGEETFCLKCANLK